MFYFILHFAGLFYYLLVYILWQVAIVEYLTYVLFFIKMLMLHRQMIINHIVFSFDSRLIITDKSSGDLHCSLGAATAHDHQ